MARQSDILPAPESHTGFKAGRLHFRRQRLVVGAVDLDPDILCLGHATIVIADADGKPLGHALAESRAFRRATMALVTPRGALATSAVK